MEATEGEKPAKKEKKEAPKNLVYKNPMDFKEKKKFKSKWEEYRFGEWKRGSGKTFVTLETEIPAMPETAITAPDEAAFHKKQVEVDTQIKTLIKALEDRKSAFHELVEQKQAQRKGNGAVDSKEVKVKIDRLRELNKQKRAIYDQVDNSQKNQGDLMKKKEALSKKIHRKWNTLELVPKGIKETTKALETGSGTHNKEA